ncbi:MAG: EAL domain-containing protein, partial [Halioglobus sp.]|nr:EAL domain-containing protein [Halioglobus sp.]
SILEDQGYVRLRDATRFNGSYLVQRLLQSSEQLRDLQKGLYVESWDTRKLQHDLMQKMQGIVARDAVGDLFLVAGEVAPDSYAAPGPKPSHSREDKPFLTRRDDSREIWLEVSAPAPDVPALAALLRRDFLFGDNLDQPLYTSFCVFDGAVELYCSAEAMPFLPGLRALREDSIVGDRLKWETAEGEAVYAYASDIFLPSRFIAPMWTVITVEEGASIFKAIDVFRWLFPAAVMLGLLNVLFVVMRQTRKRLRPLSHLRQGALKLGDGDFDARVDLSTGDELEDLADSFNGMAGRLGSQFAFLTAMSQIDSILLSQPDRFKVAESIVRQVPEVLGVELFGVLLFEPGELNNSAQLFTYQPGLADCVETQRVHADAQLRVAVADEDGLVHAARRSRYACLEPCFREGVEELRLHPLSLDGRVYGVVCLDEREAGGFDQHLLERTGDIISRLTVALSSVDRLQRLYEHAHFDTLTGLPNRLLFLDRLRQHVRQAMREGSQLCVIYADLDRFKFVNDTLGHHYGDQVLKEAAERLGSLLRQSDTVARLSGDEFAFALPGLQDPSDIVRITDGLIDLFTRPFTIQKQDFTLDISLGISLYPGDGDSAEDLLKNADLAMYRAKAQPGSGYRLFEESMNTELNERYELGQELTRAVRMGQLQMVYQPKVDASTHLVHSVEALVRWHHPRFGWISPSRFIPIAEDIGLIQDIGEFALNQACRQLAAWQSQGLPIEQVAVNVSPHQVIYSDLCDAVERAIAQSGIEPIALELEITENLLIDDYAKSEAMLASLKVIGVSLALDDFGTGYSSLGHIHQLSFDTLKIDKCFVEELGARYNAETIVASILAMGRSLGKTIVAEGVESDSQLAFLRQQGCDLYQGHYFSKPLTAEEVERVLLAGEPLPLAANEPQLSTVDNLNTG